MAWFRLPRPPRRAIPTGPGWFALIAPTFLGVAAVTATNNLLFLLLGATLGTVVLSGILSERAIRDIEVRVRALGPVYAGRPVRLEVRFCRPAPGPPRFDLRFRESGSMFRRVRPPDVLVAAISVLEGQHDAVLAPRTFPARGKVRLGRCEVATRYPFGLLTKAKDVDPGLVLLVRPRWVEPPRALESPPTDAGDTETAKRRGLGFDVYGLRERAEHDPIHRVHALRSLALGRAVVLEMDGTDRPVAELGVMSTPDADPEALERALELAQALLTAWSGRGYAVGLTTTRECFEPGSLDRMLDHLAALDPAPLGLTARRPGLWLVPAGAPLPPSGRVLAVGPSGLSS